MDTSVNVSENTTFVDALGTTFTLAPSTHDLVSSMLPQSASDAFALCNRLKIETSRSIGTIKGIENDVRCIGNEKKLREMSFVEKRVLLCRIGSLERENKEKDLRISRLERENEENDRRLDTLSGRESHFNFPKDEFTR